MYSVFLQQFSGINISLWISVTTIPEYDKIMYYTTFAHNDFLTIKIPYIALLLLGLNDEAMGRSLYSSVTLVI